MSSIYSVRDLIRNQQETLYNLIVPDSARAQVKFDFQLEFDHNGNVVPTPTFEDYTIHIMNLYDSIRKVVANEKVVEEFLFDIVSVSRDELQNKTGYSTDPVDYVKRRSFLKGEKDILEKAIANNVKKVNDYLFQFKSFSNISDLVKDTEAHFQTLKRCQYDRFKQILSKVEDFHKNVEQIPN